MDEIFASEIELDFKTNPFQTPFTDDECPQPTYKITENLGDEREHGGQIATPPTEKDRTINS